MNLIYGLPILNLKAEEEQKALNKAKMQGKRR
jgi:hypothetical protein